MTTRLLGIEILISAVSFFSVIWLLKFSILFSGNRSFESYSLFKSTLQNAGRAFAQFIETVTIKEKSYSGNLLIIELLGLCLAVSVGVFSIIALEISRTALYTYNSIAFILIYIILGGVEIKTRAWKNRDITLLFFLKSLFCSIGLGTILITFHTSNKFLFGLDCLFVILNNILFFKELHFFSESNKEASLVELGFISTLVVITSSFLSLGSVLDLKNYMIELIIIILVGVFLFVVNVTWGQQKRLLSLEKKINSCLVFSSVYIAIRLVVWLT